MEGLREVKDELLRLGLRWLRLLFKVGELDWGLLEEGRLIWLGLGEEPEAFWLIIDSKQAAII